jgi:acyl CoA:acetate/3-ketoacid CoA transferase beta subunit
LTSARRISLIVTELAVIEPTDEGLAVRELAPGVTVEQVIAATDAKLIIPSEIPEMKLAA